MRRTHRTVLAAMTVLGALAAPVAATASDTEVTFTVSSSSDLTISQASASTTLDDGGSNAVFDVTNPGAVSGTLPTTTVTDNRGELVGTWAVSVEATGDWVNQSDNSQTVAASNGRVYFDLLNAAALETSLGGLLSGMTVAGGEFTAGTSDLGTAYTLLNGTTTLTGSIEYTPTIDVTVPAGTPAGTYVATVQQTVS